MRSEVVFRFLILTPRKSIEELYACMKASADKTNRGFQSLYSTFPIRAFMDQNPLPRPEPVEGNLTADTSSRPGI